MSSTKRAGSSPGVPKGVGHAAGLDDGVARARLDHLVADLDAQAAGEHVADLVLALVGVHRRAQRARREVVLDQGKGPGGLPAVEHVADTQALELDAVAVGRADDARGGGDGHGKPLLG